jgi:CRISPR type IV-associated protein Csf1
MILYASELAAKALRIDPVGSKHTGPACVCGLCQRPITGGDLSAPMALPRTFMDHHKTARSAYVCGFCQATTQQTTMRALQRACITADGIYNLGKDESRAWFWLTPPEPPYAVVINHSTLGAFHYFWRTPVTLDNRLVQLNVDGTVYEVRRQRVQKALGYAQTAIMG